MTPPPPNHVSIRCSTSTPLFRVRLQYPDPTCRPNVWTTPRPSGLRTCLTRSPVSTLSVVNILVVYFTNQFLLSPFYSLYTGILDVSFRSFHRTTTWPSFPRPVLLDFVSTFCGFPLELRRPIDVGISPVKDKRRKTMSLIEDRIRPSTPSVVHSPP